MIPIFGPSSFRDGSGLVVDGTVYWLWSDALIQAAFSSDDAQAGFGWGLTALLAVDTRSNVQVEYFGTGSPFAYEPVRFIYLKGRELEIGH